MCDHFDSQSSILRLGSSEEALKAATSREQTQSEALRLNFASNSEASHSLSIQSHAFQGLYFGFPKLHFYADMSS